MESQNLPVGTVRLPGRDFQRGGLLFGFSLGASFDSAAFLRFVCTSEMLAGWIGAPISEIRYTCAGINHMAWYLEYTWNGKDAYPLIHQAITQRPEIYNEEQVRNEMFLALDYYVTESSGHNSEYNWWFRKRPDLIEKYCTHGTGWSRRSAVQVWYNQALPSVGSRQKSPGRCVTQASSIFTRSMAANTAATEVPGTRENG